jgi:peptide/nickel transport system permease protein
MATVSVAEGAAFAPQKMRRERSPFVKAVLSLRRNPLAMAGLVVLAIWLLIAATAPLIAPYEPNKQDISHRLQGPSHTHFFGTDDLGRDIFSRVLYGARISVPAGFLTILATATIGIILGDGDHGGARRTKHLQCAGRDHPRALAGICARHARGGAFAQTE